MRREALKQFAILLFLLLSSTFRLAAREQNLAARYLVTVDTSAAVQDGRSVAAELVAAYGGAVVESISGDTFVVSVPPAGAQKLAADHRVTFLAQQQLASAGTAGAEDAVDWASGVSYGYDGSGNITQIGNDRYSYDVASRLIDARVNDVTRDYAYDAFGNRVDCTQDRGTPDRTKCQTFSVDAATNRLKDLIYDTRGNLTSFAGHTYQWDVANMMTRDNFGATREFIYTADDERLATYEVGSVWRWTIRDTSGKVLREFTSRDGSEGIGTANWQWTNDYIYRDGVLLASQHPVLAGTETFHYHVDHLGTPRLITDNFDFVVGAHDYLPFGTELNAGDDERPTTPLKFTGHERDAWPTPGPDTLDYMHARYYSADLGRFLSVDPYMDVDKSLTDPEMWNRYVYVTNRPTKFTDADGRERLQAYHFHREGVPYQGFQREARTVAMAAAPIGLSALASSAAAYLAANPQLLLTMMGMGIGMTGGVAPVQTGQIGEELAGIAAAKIRVPIPGTLRTRIPDELTRDALREIKNVAYQARTLQLRDFLAYAKDAGVKFVLVVRENTVISKPLQKLIDDGLIELQRILPKK